MWLLLLLLLLFMMMMDRRVVDGTRMRQAKGIDGEDTNERHPRVALLTIPSGDILIEVGGAAEHFCHGRRGARVPARYVLIKCASGNGSTRAAVRVN